MSDEEKCLRQDRYVPVKFCRAMCAACNGTQGKKEWCGFEFFDDPCPWTDAEIQEWLEGYKTKRSA